MSGGTWEYVMAGMDDNSTGDGTTGQLASGRHNIFNSGFNGILTCPTCTDNGVKPNQEITKILGKIPLPTDKRYFEKYNYHTDSSVYNRGFLGDSTKEIGPFEYIKYGSEYRKVSSWYNDEGWFVNSVLPWVIRGGAYSIGNGSGIFSFAAGSGGETDWISYRLVLAF